MMMKHPVQTFPVQFTPIPQIQNHFNKQYKYNNHLRVLTTLLICILTWHQYTGVETWREKGVGNEKEERSKF
jgi:hypothetical protein